MNLKSGDELVRLDNIYAGYDGRDVIEKINLTVRSRDFIGLIGPNGSGKTTLLKVILGLIKPSAGTIRYRFPGGDRPRNSIGYVPQISGHDLSFPATVMDVVLSGLTGQIGLLNRFGRQHRREAETILSRMGMAAHAHRPLARLSGGQVQRVFLARALVSRPHLLILDEPDSYLDHEFETHFFEILKELNNRVAIILVSHDLGMISAYVTSIACLVGTLHRHDSNEITQELLDQYHCPIDLITHGDIPHRVLKRHRPDHG